MKIFKYILVFGAPAVVCGAGWGIGIFAFLALVDKYGLPDDWPFFSVLILSFCIAAAVLSSLFVQRKWRRASPMATVGWAALHVVVGATLFGTGIFPGYGTIFGFVLGFVLMPIQIFPAYLHIRLFRYLHNRFLPAPTSPERKLGGCADGPATTP